MTGGLANAFSEKVREPQCSDVSAAIEVLSAGAGEEWYVGINGVPLGPVRLSAIRQKAMQNLIDDDSLVWREGFEEWLPLRTFPELAQLVREAADGAVRPSHLPPAPQVRASLPASSPGFMIPVPTGLALNSLGQRPVVVEEVDEEPATIVASGADALSAVSRFSSDPFGASSAAAFTAAPASGLLDLPNAVLEPDAGARRSLVDDISVGVKQQVRMHPAAYVLIAIAFGFGVTGAFVFFTNERLPAPPPTIQVVTVTAPPVTVAAAPAASLDLTEVSASGAAGTGRALVSGAKVDGGKPAATNGTVSPPRVGLGDGPDIDGPNVGSGAGSKDLPQQLDQDELQRVVNSNRMTVKRWCWEPALRTKDPKAPMSAKVNVSITVAPGGNVSSASASGGSGYPGLASCVAGKVRGWKFPSAAETSRANIPFTFVSQ